MKNIAIRTLQIAAALIVTQFIFGVAFAAPHATVIELTQTACQFIEAENSIDHGFRSAKKADCEAINARTGANRLAQAKVLKLKAGKYIFRVTNKNVPYTLGFWLRGKGLGRLILASIGGAGLTKGMTKDFIIELKAGEYLYSCPLNPTPDYRLVVTG